MEKIMRAEKFLEIGKECGFELSEGTSDPEGNPTGSLEMTKPEDFILTKIIPHAPAVELEHQPTGQTFTPRLTEEELGIMTDYGKGSRLNLALKLNDGRFNIRSDGEFEIRQVQLDSSNSHPAARPITDHVAMNAKRYLSLKHWSVDNILMKIEGFNETPATDEGKLTVDMGVFSEREGLNLTIECSWQFFDELKRIGENAEVEMLCVVIGDKIYPLDDVLRYETAIPDIGTLTNHGIKVVNPGVDQEWNDLNDTKDPFYAGLNRDVIERKSPVPRVARREISIHFECDDPFSAKAPLKDQDKDPAQTI
jgi:hypothetical protein